MWPEGCCCSCVERVVMVTRAEAGWRSRGTRPCMARRGHGATQSPGHVPGTQHTAWRGAGRLPVRAHHGGRSGHALQSAREGKGWGKGSQDLTSPRKQHESGKLYSWQRIPKGLRTVGPSMGWVKKAPCVDVSRGAGLTPSTASRSRRS